MQGVELFGVAQIMVTAGYVVSYQHVDGHIERPTMAFADLLELSPRLFIGGSNFISNRGRVWGRHSAS